MKQLRENLYTIFGMIDIFSPVSDVTGLHGRHGTGFRF